MKGEIKMTNTERTENLINGVISSNVTLQSADQIQYGILMNIATSLADIADNLTAIKEKLTEKSK